MVKITKKKETPKKSTKKTPKKSKAEEPELTPWQKENQKYLKDKGVKPKWTDAAPKDDEDEKTIEAQKEETAEEAKPDKTSTAPPYESFSDRLPNVKKVRNKRLYRRLIFIVSVLMFSVLIMLYFVSTYSKLNAVEVTGNYHIDSQIIIKDSKLVQHDSLWEQFFNRKKTVAAIIKKQPRVKEANIFLSGINNLKIKITEYQVVALEAENGVYHPVLENGVILSDAIKTVENNKPILESFTDPELVKEFVASYNKLPDELKQGISEIKYTPSNANEELVNLYMNDKNRVIVNISQLNEKMKYYSQVAQQMSAPGVIDMEVGIFSYPYESQSTQDSQTDSSEIIEEN
jgi:cell division protein FtsQ